MYAFEYHRPVVAEATRVALGARTAARRSPAGRAWSQAMKLRLAQPGDLVDLGSIKELRGHQGGRQRGRDRRDDAPCRGRGSADVKKAIPALAALAGIIGDRQVRNMGTLGGSIANNDPAAD